MILTGINWQYPVVGVILLLVIIWILVQLFGKKGKNADISSCCGCGLQEACDKKKTETTKNCDKNKEKNDVNIG